MCFSANERKALLELIAVISAHGKFDSRADIPVTHFVFASGVICICQIKPETRRSYAGAIDQNKDGKHGGVRRKEPWRCVGCFFAREASAYEVICYMGSWTNLSELRSTVSVFSFLWSTVVSTPELNMNFLDWHFPSTRNSSRLWFLLRFSLLKLYLSDASVRVLDIFIAIMRFAKIQHFNTIFALIFDLFIVNSLNIPSSFSYSSKAFFIVLHQGTS